MLLTGLVGCGARESEPATSPPGPVRDEIVAALHASADAWNRGDLDGFLRTYLDSPELTFIGRDEVVRGFSTLRALYDGGHFEGGPPPRLRFDVLEVRPLGEPTALLIGRYTLQDTASGATTSTGLFTLVWGRTPEGWRILHDHTSETGPP